MNRPILSGLLLLVFIGCTRSSETAPKADPGATAKPATGGTAAKAEARSLASTIRLVGNSALGEETLRKAIDGPGVKALEDVGAVLTALYLDNGYVAAKVKPSADAATGRPTLTIEEGGRFQVGGIQIAEVGGDQPADELGNPAEIRALLNLRAGDPFNRSSLLAFQEAVKDRYDAAGFSNALVVPSTDLDEKHLLIKIRFEIERGVPYKVAAIQVAGADPSREARIKELLGYAAGEVYSRVKNRLAQKRIEDSGLFNKVEIRVEENAPAKDKAEGEVRVTLTVEERPGTAKP